MVKKGPEAKKIALELDKEYENFKAKIAPKMYRRATGRLRRLQRYMRRLKPLKVTEHFISLAKDDIKTKLERMESQISWAKKKSASDKVRMKNLIRELQKLRKEVPQLKKNVRLWSKGKKHLARKHRSIMRDLSKVRKRIAKEEKRKDKVIKALQKYFQ